MKMFQHIQMASSSANMANGITGLKNMREEYRGEVIAVVKVLYMVQEGGEEKGASHLVAFLLDGFHTISF